MILGKKLITFNFQNTFLVYFLHKNTIFREENLKFSGFSQNVALHRGGRGSTEISISHKKLQLHRGGGLRPPSQKFDPDEPRILKNIYIFL